MNGLERKILKFGKKVLDEIYIHNHDINVLKEKGRISVENDLIYVNSHLTIILDIDEIKSVMERRYDRS